MRPTGPGQPAHLLLAVLDLLVELDVRYAVVGAFAVSFHGVPRYTDDADAVIWMEETGKTPRDLVDSLRAAGDDAALKRGDLDDPISGIIFVTDKHENRVDLVLGIRGMDRNASERSIPAKLLDSSIRVLAAEDLIAMKVFAGGVQDLEDVRGILQVSAEKLNSELLRKLAAEYGADVAANVDQLLKQFPPSE